jgi:hypothetical protein
MLESARFSVDVRDKVLNKHVFVQGHSNNPPQSLRRSETLPSPKPERRARGHRERNTYAAFSQLIIQGMPNRSTSIPKRWAQKVS